MALLHASRRDFLKTGALAGAGYFVAAGLQAKESTSAIQKLNFACVGVGGKGKSDTEDAAMNGNVIAVCDIDENTLATTSQAYPSAERFYDYREMFDRLGSKIDAVTISTPDHTHAAITAMAMRLGKHCFTQKPLTHSLAEARTLTQLARETGVATQMSNQGTANPGLRKAAAMIRAGALGAVTDIHIWTNRPIWPQGGARPSGSLTPKFLHWDQWIGPATYRRYTEVYHPFSWRGWWDFGTGALGDMVCHMMNMPFMALDLRNPTTIEAKTSGHNQQSFPSWSVITYKFPKTKDRPEVTLTWYDGGKRPKRSLLEGEKLGAAGILLIGEKGKLYSPSDYANNSIFLGGAKEVPAEFEPAPDGGHFVEFVRAAKGGPPAKANFADYAGALTETVLCGNLAVWKQGKVEWDAENLRANDAPELDGIIERPYRPGYTL